MKTIGQSNNMTSQRPTKPGWYWYQLAGSWPLQPVFVFDSGPDGLMYTLESISVGESDDERDGLFLDDAAPEALWSQESLFLPY